ncbi:oxidoreductase [Sphingomonas astaxanthinifaciens]|uniref:Short-chain dehydrogenase/reductase n=1 Tax=Sphingomonas astaxanthinifaciens DSM 22298 TaxID=1123267 RepID=A0ABQ5ZBD5_9SPHN|nr:oxidoreductase [Sphingomonas astaxanthinifaciens]GLR48099.1 short-chain dehydrogenase/reductase [Sphingomonas astaxanthinifaciens DSM 22298]
MDQSRSKASKVILVTGASSGIGKATAIALAEAGHRVFAGVRKPSEAIVHPLVELVKLDVTNPDDVVSAVAHVEREAGRLDVLVNNAGTSLVGAVEETSDKEASSLFQTNFFGPLRLSRAVLPLMRRQGQGLIVNVSSVLGFLPAPFMGLYASSKHALEGLSESLDHEVRSFGVRVILVEPSFTRTSLDTNASVASTGIDEYAAARSKSVAAVRRQIAEAPPPSGVAAEILSVIDGKHHLRRPADRRARILSKLRRWVPAAQFDKSLRASFGLS